MGSSDREDMVLLCDLECMVRSDGDALIFMPAVARGVRTM